MTRSWRKHVVELDDRGFLETPPLQSPLSPPTPAPGSSPTGPAVARQSRLVHCSALHVGSDLLHKLQVQAAELVMERLLCQPQHMSIMSPHGNTPQSEIFFNTKLSVQFTRAGPPPGAAARIQMVLLCPSCVGKKDFDSWLHERCGSCRTGCGDCVGRQCWCPSCRCTFTRRWTYETGSGRSSVGRDIQRCAPCHWAG